MSTPMFSVIVPAHRCAPVLERALRALLASDLSKSQWELIVVDDASHDDTPTLAESLADLVVRLEDGPHGPAFARNRGAERARGGYLVFIDSDVCVQPTTLSQIASVMADVDVSAMFGAYDTLPPAQGFVSQYRNLLHHYVHTVNAGIADTFWAGCGAVRTDDFFAVGMFDEVRFPRPQIEDIELGYRLTDSGRRIVLNPDVQGTHLKRWTFSRMVTTDFHDRAVPWTALLLERRGRSRAGTLNVKTGGKLLTLLAACALATLLIAGVTRDPRWLLLSAFCVVSIIVGDMRLLAWFARERGLWFAVRVIPFRLLFFVLSGAGAAWAIFLHICNRVGAPRSTRHWIPGGEDARARPR